MRDYFKETTHILKDLQFDYLGKRYRGRGVMTWKPAQGFHIEAPLDLGVLPELREIPFGKIGAIRRSENSSIRMVPRNYSWAISPSIPLFNRFDVLIEKRLSINLNRVIFSKYYSHDLTGEYLRGYALYETKKILYLFDEVDQTNIIEIQDSEVLRNSNQSRRGINYKGEKGQIITGYLLDEKYLKVDWSLPRENFTRNYNWRLAEAIQYSLSILLGQRISLLQRVVNCGNQERVEIRQQQTVETLELLSPLVSYSTLNKEYFEKLVDLIIQDKQGSDVCRNVFQQLVEASRQRNWQVRELLVATILEAALRNIYNEPFQARKRGWDVGKGLQNFLKEYLSDEWSQIHSSVMKAHTYLRDRNAHPDWLFMQGGTLSEEEMTKSLDSMIYLSRFYGYMLLALAGIKDLKPLFPRSHAEWEPAMKIILAERRENI